MIQRLRLLGWLILAALLLISLSVVSPAPGVAQSGIGDDHGIAQRVTRLEAAMAQLQVTNAQLKNQIDALTARTGAVEVKTQDMGRLVDPFTGQPMVRFSGVNVQIVDGSGDTEGAVNGTGNLIVGYNESDEFSGRSRNGSHNLIVGSRNDYGSYGGIVAGRYNTIEGRYATVTAGSFNLASGFGATVSGGDGNRATNTFSSVSGGFLNYADGDQSSVSGGLGVVQVNTFGWSAGSEGTAVSGAFSSP